MVWKKTSPETIALMDEALDSMPCRKKLMFGGVAYFVNDNMFAGVHQDMPFLRLSEADRDAIMVASDEVSLFEPMEGRPMKEYVLVSDGLSGDTSFLRSWLRKSFDHAATLPPGGGKKRR